MKWLEYSMGGLILVLLGGGGYLGHQFLQLQDAHGETLAELSATKEELSQTKEALSGLSQNLEVSQNDNKLLADALENEQEKNENFEDQIRDITGTVGKLDKLSKIDPELLEKYSKVFFLNENYMPEKLVAIPKKYVYNEDEPEFIHHDVEPFFKNMLDDAQDDDIELWVVSAFRSFDEQADLKGKYLVSYGTGANTFSADQGYSEHQLGTTIDFTTTGLGGGLQGFETTQAYEWLVDNAYKYGFVLSYPEENVYYVFEPWHWRFVGTELAKKLHRDHEYFYGLEQREIDEYLISLFD